MFATLIAEENMPKIVEVDEFFDHDKNSLGRYYTNRPVLWVFIRGFVTRRGNVIPWTVLPMSYFKHHFDYDPEKIKTDWAITVRKD